MKISVISSNLGIGQAGNTVHQIKSPDLKEVNRDLKPFGIEAKQSESVKALRSQNSIQINLFGENEEIVSGRRLGIIFPEGRITPEPLDSESITKLIFGRRIPSETEHSLDLSELYILERNCSPNTFFLKGVFQDELHQTSTTPLELVFGSSTKKVQPSPTAKTVVTTPTIVQRFDSSEVAEKLKQKCDNKENIKPEFIPLLLQVDFNLDSADITGLVNKILDSNVELNFFYTLGQNKSIANHIYDNFNSYKSRINNMAKTRLFYQGLILQHKIARIITRPWSEFDTPASKAAMKANVPSLGLAPEVRVTRSIKPMLVAEPVREKSQREILEGLIDAYNPVLTSGYEVERIVNGIISYQESGSTDLDTKILGIAENPSFRELILEASRYLGFSSLITQCKKDPSTRTSFVNRLLEDGDIQAKFAPGNTEKVAKKKAASKSKPTTNQVPAKKNTIDKSVEPKLIVSQPSPQIPEVKPEANSSTSWQTTVNLILAGKEVENRFEVLAQLVKYDKSKNRNNSDDDLVYRLGIYGDFRVYVNGMIRGIIDDNTKYIKAELERQKTISEDQRTPFIRGLLT